MKKKAAKQIVTDCHARLDTAGIPSADGAPCDDPTCHGKLEHRIAGLIAERDRLRALEPALLLRFA
ncbi:hypothetical protein, partial [Caballeronia sp. ATUFL_F1_KS4A]|uniref:hypothetical protein n=1 Tax=Caballeronia sp. ATUFL_F1_KS4A TaxID=2921768 RepID=UPI0020287483